jgi:spore maturation protein CgeB
MRILVVGAIQGGTVPLGKSMAKAFAAGNQQVEFLDYSDFREEFILVRQSGSEERLRQFFLSLKIRLLEKVVSSRPDMIFGVAQSPLNDIEILSQLKNAGIALCYWFTEDYQIFDYWKSIARFFDYFFTIQQEPLWQELRKLGLNNYHYMPMAFDDSKAVAPPGIQDIPVSFMGAPYPNRVYYLPRIDGSMQIFGEEWSRHPSCSVVTGNRRISEEEAHQIYLRTKININLHSSTSPEGFADGDFVNPRTFEIAGLGAFQLTDWRQLLSLHFDLNKEIVALSNAEEMKQAVKYFLGRENERAAFARRAQKRVLEEHTYKSRAAAIIKLLR